MGCVKTFFLGAGFTCLLFLAIPLRIKQSSTDLETEFDNFIKQFNKSYANEKEYADRFEAFKKSLEEINKLNSLRTNESSALYGVTKYSDMSAQEFLNSHLQSNLHYKIFSHNNNFDEESLRHQTRHTRAIADIPSALDWREKGVVTPVNNQRLCGACWAFTTAENIESMNAIKTGKLVPLSIQQLIDCAGYSNNGCNGGDMCTLLKWMTDKKVKLQPAKDYPLHLRNEACKMNSSAFGIAVDTFACDNMVDHEKYIVNTLATTGPVAVAINALSWQHYLGGVIQFHCDGSQLNHAVQIVGYNLTADIPHYIVRNSWGTDFGEAGYLYIGIGKNLCGLAHEVSMLTVG